MENLRGFGSDTGSDDADEYDLATHEDVAVIDHSHLFGTDERRMHVRAYNFWAGLLGDRAFPAIDDLDPDAQTDFGPHGVLLDFTSGAEDPAIQFLGEELAKECGADDEIAYLSDVPSRSLLSRITDHYMQILANQAPIGFEAEFVNQRGRTILYRGILLPFSSDDDTIDFIYGVINWKELADQSTTDALILEVNEAIQSTPRRAEPVPVWADAPVADDDTAFELDAATIVAPDFGVGGDDIFELAIPAPDFGADYAHRDSDYDVEESVAESELESGAFDLAESMEYHEPEAPEPYSQAAAPTSITGTAPSVAVAATPDSDAGLAEWLRHAQSIAAQAQSSEDRTRNALYQAIGRAYDFALVAERHPAEFAALLTDQGLVQQERAPMTPVVKLVFGAGYDKTRLTEFATALTYAYRSEMPMGSLSPYLENYGGGLKALVREERRLRNPQSQLTSAEAELRAIYDRLRTVQAVPLDQIDCNGNEFVVLVGRRDDDGVLGVVGAVIGDAKFTEKVIRRAVG